MTTPATGCGCPPTAPDTPTTGVHHVFITVNDLARARPFYTALMPRLGYPGTWDFAADGNGIGFLGTGGSFWVKQADPRYRGDIFSKDRVGLCEIAFRAENRAQIDALARDLPAMGGHVTEGPQEYPHYVPGYYAVFFTDPDGIKLEFVHIPG